MISLASVSANIKVIGRGGGRKKLHSHTMAFINAPGPAITYLPRSIEKEDLQVVFSNATAKDMDFAKKKFVRVRRNQIDQMAAFVKENNPAYARATRLQTDIDSLEEDSILVDHCAEDNRDLITEVINDASRVNTDVDDTSTSLMETSGGLFNLTPEPPPPLPDDDEINADEEKGSSPMRKFQVRRSNALLGSRDAEFYGAAFPELFAYGRGTPNSTRPVAVSLEAGLRHLLMLSNRRCAQHTVFALVAFDEMARARSHRNLAIKTRANPSATGKVLQLPPSALSKLVRYDEEMTNAARSGRPLPKLRPSADLEDATSVLSTLKHSSGKAFGTNEERAEMRRRVYAYYHTFGRPHLMVTMSPRDDNSFWIAVHSGFDANTPEAAAKSFDDLWRQGKTFPHQDDIRRASLKDPTLAAMHFDDFANFFFEKVVGWDKAAGKAVNGGGLFGKVLAYAAGVETQGGGTLHFHALIFLDEFPATGQEEEAWELKLAEKDGALLNETFGQQYCNYADSLASAIYPVYDFFIDGNVEAAPGDTAVFHCPLCKTGHVEPIESFEHEQKEKKKIFLLKTNRMTKFAPFLSQCSGCKKKFTAQSLRHACTKFLADLAGIHIGGLHSRVAEMLSGSKGGFPLPETLNDASKESLRAAISQGLNKLPHEVPPANSDGKETCFVDTTHTCGNDSNCNESETEDEKPVVPAAALTQELKEHIRVTIEVSYAIKLLQEHKFGHHGSCFKRNNKKHRCKGLKVCRYDFPNLLRNYKTIMGFPGSKNAFGANDGDMELHLKRAVGCEYLTPFNDQLFALTRSNHDVAFLRGRSIMYCVKYPTKPQETADSAAVVDRLVAGFECALERKKSIEAENPEWTDFQRGSSRLHSLLYQLTSVHEIASTMASFYVYRNEMAFYESHPEASLVLASALPVARSEEVTLSVNPHASDDGTHTCWSPYLDFLFRPLECKNTSWYDYLACFFLKPVRKKSSNSDDDADAEDNSSDDEPATSTKATALALELMTGHPKEGKYQATLRSVRAVVNIIGPGLPSEAQCDGDDEKIERFAMSSMLMFVPHRNCSDLKSNDQTWAQAWENAKQNDTVCPSGIAFIRFNEDRWKAIYANQESSAKYYKDMAEKLAELHDEKLPESDKARNDAYSTSDDDESAEENDYASDNEDGTILDFADQGDVGKAPNRPLQFQDSDVHLPIQGTPLTLRTPNVQNLESGFKQPPPVDTPTDNATSSSVFPAPRELKVSEVCDLVNSGIAATRRSLKSSTANEEHRQLRNRHIGTEQASSTVLVTVDPQKPAKALSIYASLNEVSTLFDLTDIQDTAFSIIGEALLQSFADFERGLTPDELHNLREAHQRTLFLHGLAGSGKSFVIRAWIALAESWNHPNAVRTCAPTGIAAVNVEGSTIASLYNGSAVSRDKQLDFLGCLLLVVDEISMASHLDIYNLNKFLSTVFEETALPFGGTNLVLAGDHSQLKPVRKAPLYKKPDDTSNEKHMAGYRLYRDICNRNTICLDRVMRSKNPEYIKLQENVRAGNWSKATLDTLNSRHNADLGSSSQDSDKDPEADYCPTVVINNDTRQALYEVHMASISDKLNARNDDRPIVLMAEMSVSSPARNKKKRKRDLSNRELKYLDTLPDSAFKRTPVGFFLYYGANALVTQNLGVQYGIANGTRGIIVGWQFPPNTTFKNVCYHGVKARMPSAPVECVYVQVTNVRLKRRAPNQPVNLPVNTICLPRVAVQVDDPVVLPANLSHRKNVRLKLTQIPLRQAIVLTTYSIQSVQFSKYIIAETAPKSMYVQMSRGTEGVASFTLRRPLDKNFAKAASPSAALAAEMTRLQDLHKATKSRFEKTQKIMDSDDDEPPAKRVRSDSTSSSLEESNGSMSLGSSDSESDESSSDIDMSDE
jgi:hypothetical protein